MARVRASFLVRFWQLDGTGQRIEVEHIQSGVRTVCPTAAAAVDWICARGDGAAGQPATENDQAPKGGVMADGGP